MRIAITGSACQGKSTLIQDIIKEWPGFTTPEKTYRDELKSDSHSKYTTEDTQWSILNSMCDLQQKYRKGDSVIYDRCPLDNIAYSMWGNFHGKVSDEFVEKCIPIVRESMRAIDIIFFTPITKVAPVKIEDNDTRETDSLYIKEVDAILKNLFQQWKSDDTPFFIKDDKPAMIEIFGDPVQRIEMVKLYLDSDGDAMKEGGIINPQEIEELEKLFGLS